MTRIIDYILLCIAGSSLIGFAYWAWKDIRNDHRPGVTDSMIEKAYQDQVMDSFDEEYDSIDWESDD